MEFNNRKLPALLLDLHKSSRSGILRLETKTVKKQLVLHQGMLVYAESNQPEEHLAKVMVTEKLLASSALKAIASCMKEGKNSEVAVLALPNAQSDDVLKGRRRQAIAIAASFWTWTEFDLQLFAGEDPAQNRINLQMPLPELLVLSARHAVAKKLVTWPKNYFEGMLAPSAELIHRAAAIPFQEDESEILSSIKDPRKFTELRALFPENALLCLLTLGLLGYQAPAERPVSSRESVEEQISNLNGLFLRLKQENFYRILSISSQARPEEIQTAYHNLARQFHPDRFQSEDFSADTQRKAQHVFAAINEAYRILKNPATRKAYDENPQKPAEYMASATANAASSPPDPEKMAATLFQSGKSFFTQNDYEKAAEYFKRCLWLRPQNALYNHYMGAALSKNPRLHKEAEHHLLRALEIDALSTESHLELARLYLAAQQHRKAEHHVRQFLHRNSHHQEAEALLRKLGDKEKN